MYARITLRTLIVVLLLVATMQVADLAVPRLSAAQECGDVDRDGGVTASDALRVLRRAVDLDVELDCATGECSALEQRIERLERQQFIVEAANGNELGVLRSGSGPRLTVWNADIGAFMHFDYPNAPSSNGDPQIAHSRSDGSVAFVNEGCSGTPYRSHGSVGSVNLMDTVSPDGRTLYRPIRAAPSGPIEYRSVIQNTSGNCLQVDPPRTLDYPVRLEEVFLPFTLNQPGPYIIRSLWSLPPE